MIVELLESGAFLGSIACTCWITLYFKYFVFSGSPVEIDLHVEQSNFSKVEEYKRDDIKNADTLSLFMQQKIIKTKPCNSSVRIFIARCGEKNIPRFDLPTTIYDCISGENYCKEGPIYLKFMYDEYYNL